MRRASIVLAGTAAGLAAVLSFKPREPALPVASAASSAPPTATASSRSGAGTATGDAIPTSYGNAQVRVTVSVGRITKIETLQLPSNEPKSVMISTAAEPLLRQSAITKQSAAIDAVSGATFTSAGYEASLQSALDKLGFKAADGTRGSSTVPNADERRGGPPGGGFR